MLNDRVKKVTDDITKRSEKTRSDYLARIDAAAGEGPSRTRLSCGNLAHGFAACQPGEKDDFSALSDVVPSLTRIYPNGSADVNHFQAAGGMGLLVSSLMDAGLLHKDILTVAAERGLESYRQEPKLENGALAWNDAPAQSLDPAVLAPVEEPFSADGGLKVLDGNLGRANVNSAEQGASSFLAFET